MNKKKTSCKTKVYDNWVNFLELELFSQKQKRNKLQVNFAVAYAQRSASINKASLFPFIL